MKYVPYANGDVWDAPLSIKRIVLKAHGQIFRTVDDLAGPNSTRAERTKAGIVVSQAYVHQALLALVSMYDLPDLALLEQVEKLIASVVNKTPVANAGSN